MKFPVPLEEAILLKRRSNSIADIVLINQQKHTIFCANPNRLVGCDTLGSRIWYSKHSHESSAIKDTWELVEVDGGYLVCVNEKRAQQVILDAIAVDSIPELLGYKHIAANATFQNENIDFLLSQDSHLYNKNNLKDEPQSNECFVSVQSVTFGDEIHRGFFPDMQNKKTNRQLSALIAAKAKGYRAVWMYCVMNAGIDRVFPADHIDSEFGCLLRQAVIQGVEIMAYRVNISLEEMSVGNAVDVLVPARMLCTPRAEKSGK